MAKRSRNGRAALARRKPKPTLSIRPVAARLPAFPDLAPRELAAFVDETVDFVGARERAAGLVRQEAADYLFRHVYLNSVRLALDPQAPEPPAASALKERAGQSFALTQYELRRYVVVGAMNHHLRSELWQGLPFETKLELVRLLRDPGDLSDFEAAVLYAATGDAGSKAVRAFVNERLPENTQAGQPRGLTPKGARRFTATVEQLDDVEHQERLADRIARLDDAGDREALVTDLERASRNLLMVVEKVRSRVKTESK